MSEPISRVASIPFSYGNITVTIIYSGPQPWGIPVSPSKAIDHLMLDTLVPLELGAIYSIIDKIESFGVKEGYVAYDDARVPKYGKTSIEVMVEVELTHAVSENILEPIVDELLDQAEGCIDHLIDPVAYKGLTAAQAAAGQGMPKAEYIEIPGGALSNREGDVSLS